MKRVVILGQAPRSFEHPDDAEIWVINGPRFPKRWDVLFQLHGLDHIEHKHGSDYLLSTLYNIWPPKRLIMTRTHECLPRAERLDIDRLKASAGDYLTGSFAIAIALAVVRGAREIILDGVMFAGGPAQWGAGEGWAVPCIEYHLGRAAALGVRHVVPAGCGLFAQKDFIYGFEGPGSV
jgi:hypothetical protein